MGRLDDKPGRFKPARQVMSADLNKILDAQKRSIVGANGVTIENFGDRMVIRNNGRPWPHYQEIRVFAVIGEHTSGDFLLCAPLNTGISDAADPRGNDPGQEVVPLPPVYSDTLGSTTPPNRRFYIAKPWLLQRTPWDGKSVYDVSSDSYTINYSFNNIRVVSRASDGLVVTERLSPPYYIGEIIRAFRWVTGHADPAFSGEESTEIVWQDINEAGRRWQADPPGIFSSDGTITYGFIASQNRWNLSAICCDGSGPPPSGCCSDVDSFHFITTSDTTWLPVGTTVCLYRVTGDCWFVSDAYFVDGFLVRFHLYPSASSPSYWVFEAFGWGIGVRLKPELTSEINICDGHTFVADVDVPEGENIHVTGTAHYLQREIELIPTVSGCGCCDQEFFHFIAENGSEYFGISAGEEVCFTRRADGTCSWESEVYSTVDGDRWIVLTMVFPGYWAILVTNTLEITTGYVELERLFQDELIDVDICDGYIFSRGISPDTKFGQTSLEIIPGCDGSGYEEIAYWCIDDTTCFQGTESEAALEGSGYTGPYTQEECEAACGSSGSGGGDITVFSEGSKQGKGVTEFDFSGGEAITFGDGDVIIVVVVHYGPATFNNGAAVSFNGGPMTARDSHYASGDLSLQMFSERYATGGTSNLLVNSITSDATAVAIIRVSGLTSGTPVQNSSGGDGTSTDPTDIGFSSDVPTARYIQAAIATNGPDGDTEGSWIAGFSDGGQDIGTTGGSDTDNVRLCEGGLITSGTFASFTTMGKTGITSREWINKAWEFE